MLGILFVDRDGNTCDPHSDAAAAEYVLRTCGPDVAVQFDELLKALGSRDAWMRHRATGYACHAITCRNGHTAIVIGQPTGWHWQVSRRGVRGPVRDIRDTPAATADEALRLADEFIDCRVRR